MNALETVERLKQRFPNEPEYIQAVSQVLGTIEEEYNRHPEFDRANLIERLCIPDRIIWAIVFSTTMPLARTKAAFVSTLQ